MTCPAQLGYDLVKRCETEQKNDWARNNKRERERKEERERDRERAVPCIVELMERGTTMTNLSALRRNARRSRRYRKQPKISRFFSLDLELTTKNKNFLRVGGKNHSR